MLAKGMLSKKINFLKILITLILLFFIKDVRSSELNTNHIVEYIENLVNFSASFIQKSNQSIEEGSFYIGEKRVRVEYDLPSKILIILDKKKAMYYNYELDENEFFNPKDTSAWFFFEIFKNPEFFLKSNFSSIDKNLVIYTKGISNDELYELTVYFEEDPLILRKINLKIGDSSILISIFDHRYEEVFNKNFFKLINPTFFN